MRHHSARTGCGRARQRGWPAALHVPILCVLPGHTGSCLVAAPQWYGKEQEPIRVQGVPAGAAAGPTAAPNPSPRQSWEDAVKTSSPLRMAPATHVAAADMLISPVQYDHRASRPRHREALANAVTKARTLIGEEDPLSTPLRLKDQRPQALVEEASVTWPQEPTLRAPVASIPRDAVEVLRRKNAEIMRRVEEARRKAPDGCAG